MKNRKAFGALASEGVWETVFKINGGNVLLADCHGNQSGPELLYKHWRNFFRKRLTVVIMLMIHHMKCK